MSELVIQVKNLNEYVAKRLNDDAFLNEIWIEGEIDRVARRAPDTAYFELKDDSAVVACVSFRFAGNGLDEVIQHGSRVLVKGAIGLYVRGGRFQINVTHARFAGEGDLKAQLDKLKQALAAEGVFSEQRKRSLPPYPAEIAVVTSGSGAALRDIEKVAARRNPSVRLRVYPVLVQGKAAPDSIVAALRQVMEDSTADIVIVARGGGSATDLSAFNDERVVRAVAGSTIPVISAVGHETDVTLCDLAADRRASTPSVAAELAVPEAEAIRAEIRSLMNGIQRGVYEAYRRIAMQLRTEQLSLRAAGTDYRIRSLSQQIDQLMREQKDSVLARLRQLESGIGAEEKTLLALNPTRILSSGYAVVLKDGRRVTSAGEIERSDRLELMFSDGTVRVTAE